MRYVFAAIALLAVSTLSAAAAPPISTDGTDPKTWDLGKNGPVVAPGNHRVVWENSEWRVIDVTVPAGSKEPQHLHPLCSVLIFAPDIPRVIDHDGSDKEIQAPWVGMIPQPGADPRIPFVGLQPPQALHSIQNPDPKRELHLLRVELKRGCGLEAPRP